AEGTRVGETRYTATNPADSSVALCLQQVLVCEAGTVSQEDSARASPDGGSRIIQGAAVQDFVIRATHVQLCAALDRRRACAPQGAAAPIETLCDGHGADTVQHTAAD